jgi:hypothetical protein
MTKPFFPRGPRKCPICQRAPRRHDPMESLFVPLGLKVASGIYQACWDCAEEIDPGGRPPLEIPLPPPSNPQALSDAMNYCLFFCGICKTYIREDEQLDSMRLNPRDIRGLGHLDLFDDPDEPVDDLKPGCYRSCKDCIEKYKRVVFERLSRLRVTYDRRGGIVRQGESPEDGELMFPDLSMEEMCDGMLL